MKETAQHHFSGRRAPTITLALIVLLAIPFVNGFSPTQNVAQAQSEGICNRSPIVQSAILRSIDADNCTDVTAQDLASIDLLYISFIFGGLSANDLDGLTGLEWLILLGSNIIPFPTGIFDDLTNLDYLYVRDLGVRSIPSDTFSELPSLPRLGLNLPMVSGITPADSDETGAFNGLDSLEYLWLTAHSLTAIEEGTFNSLGSSANFQTLIISGDEIGTIAPNAFDDLAELEYLRINADKVTDIQADTFSGLGKITWLIFFGENVTSVAPGAFTGVGELIDDETRKQDEDYSVIYLVLDSILSLEAGIFSGLPNLERIGIAGDVLATLQPDVFDGLDSLEVLYLDGGNITTVSAGVFDDFPDDHKLSTLRLNRGAKEILSAGVLNELSAVRAIDIWDKSLTTLSNNFFNGVTGLELLLFDDAGNISRVESRAFNGLSDLRILRLNNNKISSLPNNVFAPLVNLQILEIGGNRFTRLPASFVQNPPCSLRTFDISGQGSPGILSVTVDGVKHHILATLPQPNTNGCGTDDGIRHLILDDVPMTQADLDLIEPYKKLETLSLANTGITAVQAINVRRGQDLVTLKSLDLSNNDLSALNEPAQRAALGIVVRRLTNLTELHLAGTRIDGDTALVIVQNLNPRIVELTLADNNLADWNHPDLAHDLRPAWDRLSENWDLIDLSNTAIDSRAASAIVPYIERTHEGIPEEVIAELDESGIHSGVTLDLSRNYLDQFGSGWLRNWEFVNVIDISCNEITSIRPEAFLPVSRHLETLFIYGNPLDQQQTQELFDTVLPDLDLHTSSSRQCNRSNYSIPKSVARVLRLEPSIRNIAINPGQTVRLAIDVYGRQGLLDNSLAENVFIIWDDEHVGGIFTGIGRQVEYIAPDRPGNYTIIARVSSEQCHGDFEQCTAHFQLKVNRRTHVDTTPVELVNPTGVIPTILTGDDGTPYEVITPVDGGQFIGDGFDLAAPAGAVQNGEFVGVNVQKGGSASNAGATHHRYTIAGDWYNIGVVDGSEEPIADYLLNRPALVCIPLPRQLRSNVDDISIVAMKSGDESFTVLTSRVRISPDGSTQVCGNLSALPANIAAAKLGAPSVLPIDEEAQSNDAAPPDTGGHRLPMGATVALMLLGTAVAIVGVSYAIRKRMLRQ